MGDHSDCWLAEYGSEGEGIGPVLIGLMLAAGCAPAPAGLIARPAEPQCDVEFEDGRRCAKPTGHWTPKNGDLHAPDRPPVPGGAVTTATDPTATIREEIKNALSAAGAYCGDCGFQPGDRGCRACERCWEMYADALMPIIVGQAAMLLPPAEHGRPTARTPGTPR
jgi:hypothetical protein